LPAAFGRSGAVAPAGFLIVASLFGGALAAALSAGLVLRLGACPARVDLRAVRAGFVLLPEARFRAFAGVFRFAACLRFLAMGTAVQFIDDQKTLKAGI
jgi:hypothetical protein